MNHTEKERGYREIENNKTKTVRQAGGAQLWSSTWEAEAEVRQDSDYSLCYPVRPCLGR